MTLEQESFKWVFETNGHKWSNNDDTAGDNMGSFIAGANSTYVKRQIIEAKIDTIKSIISSYDLLHIDIENLRIQIHILENQLKTLE